MAKVLHQERGSNWIETYTGRSFWPTAAAPAEVCIEDIAHALSNICRFNGHTAFHYSVAQHSVYCAEYAKRLGLSAETRLHCLLHDASEAYLCDIPRPIKGELNNYKQLEDRLQAVILLGLRVPRAPRWMEKTVREIDDIILQLEAVALMRSASWAREVDSHGIKIMRQTPENVEYLFKLNFDQLHDSVSAELE